MSGKGVSSMLAMLDCLEFPVVVGTDEHSGHQRTMTMVKAVLLLLSLFEMFHAKDVQIRSAAHRALPAALLLLEQYSNIILMLLARTWPKPAPSQV
jgi:hypothetical protein